MPFALILSSLFTEFKKPLYSISDAHRGHRPHMEFDNENYSHGDILGTLRESHNMVGPLRVTGLDFAYSYYTMIEWLFIALPDTQVPQVQRI